MQSWLISLFVCGIFTLSKEINGQCPSEVPEPITRCEGHSKTGPAVYVDFDKINRPCSCAVISLFTGALLVSTRPSSFFCYDEATVALGSKTVVFQCNAFTSYTFDVQANDTVVNVTDDYKSDYTSGDFHVCMGFSRNGGGGTVSVTCGNSTTGTTSRTYKTSPTTTTTIFSTVATESSTSTTTQALTPEIKLTASPAETSFSAISWEETDTTPTTHKATSLVDSSPQKSTFASSDNTTYIVTGTAAGGLVLVLVFTLLVAVTVIRKKKGRKHVQTLETDEALEHTNRAFDENNSLPENPLYHSAQPMDKVGYSSVQKNQLGLPPTEAINKKKTDPNYDVPTNNKPINDSDTSPMLIYAVPNKSGASLPEENEPQAMYAQVSKPIKSASHAPMHSTNLDGLLYLEVEKDATSANGNNP